MFNSGNLTNTKYDNCANQTYIKETTSPFAYQMQAYKFNNCNRCKVDRIWQPFELVDIETELRGQNHPLSQCDQFKHSQACINKGKCMSTFSKKMPIVLEPSLCPIVTNNIPRATHPGYTMPKKQVCPRK